MLRTSTFVTVTGTTLAVLAVGAVATTGPALADSSRGEPESTVEFVELARYTAAGAEFGEGGAEIVAHDAETQRLFIANGSEGTVDVVDVSHADRPELVEQVSLADYGASITGVGAGGGLAAVAVHPEDAQAEPGRVVLLDTATLEVLADVEAGFLPDAVVFAPDRSVAVVANEGEPSDDYLTDPEGSVTIVDLHTYETTQVGFQQFDGREDELDESIRIYGLGASVAQDLEPENVTFSADSATAWVTLQENNAIAEVDIASGEVSDLAGLGTKDWNWAGSGFDASNDDGEIAIRHWPVRGIPQPDAVAGYEVRGQTFLVTANEGDARAYDGFSEEARLADVELCEGFEYEGMGAEELQADENLGRLNITTVDGFDEEAGCLEEIHAYGGRSFSIYTPDGTLVHDSGSDFEEITAEVLGRHGFNANNDESGEDAFDSRSDDKGPEPEGVAVGQAYGGTYAFIGLERVGGVMTYRIDEPGSPEFVSYTNGRDFGAETAEESVDLGPEGVLFVTEEDSPTGRPLVVLSHEVTGTTTIYQVDEAKERRGGDDGN